MSLDMASCTACSLRAGCSQVVPGRAVLPTMKPAVMLLAENPDAEADLMGEVLPGRAGKFLRQLLAEAGFSPGQLYWTYLVKCMGKAKAVELATCREWLNEEIRLVAPEIIITLGTPPLEALVPGKMRLNVVAGALVRVPGLPALVAPWWPAHQLLMGTRDLSNKSVAFFRAVLVRSVTRLEKKCPS